MWTSWLPQLIAIAMLAMIAGTIFGVARFRSRPWRLLPALLAGFAGGLIVFLILHIYFFFTIHPVETSWMTLEVSFFEHPPTLPWRPIVLASEHDFGVLAKKDRRTAVILANIFQRREKLRAGGWSETHDHG